MTADSIAFADIAEVGRQLRTGEISVTALTDLMLDRIETHDPTLNSFITVTADLAREAAQRAEQELAAGRDRGLLHGIPVGVKDLFDLRGVRNTFGSLLFKDNVSAVDSTVVEKLQGAGAIVLGKTNLHEFATGTTSVNPHYGPIRNPWDTNCYPGGSSGGSAAAVAAGLCFGAVGSDTGCSIRQPAHLCNLVGLKPTFGRVSKFGALPVSWSMDHAGPLTRTVQDCAIWMNAIAGYDPRDPGCVDRPVADHLEGLDRGVEGLRIGIAREYFLDHCQPDVAAGFAAALTVLERLGARLETITLPDMNAARAAGHTIIFTEFHAAFYETAKRQPEDFSEANRAFVELGGLFTAKHVVQAQRVRRLITEQTIAAMTGYDAIVMPTCPVTTAEIEPFVGTDVILHTQNTVPFDAISLPAVSIPAGFDAGGRPFGLQIVGAPFDEAGVLRIGQAFEQATSHHTRRPPGFTTA